MSNYHVEPVDKPAALTQGGHQVPPQGAGPGPVAPPADARRARRRDRAVARRARGRHDRVHLAEPVRWLRGAVPRSGRSRTSRPRTRPSRSRRASRPTTPEARAFVMLVDPGQQRLHRRRGHDRRRDRTQRARALPALSAPGLQAQPVLRNFWLECPCHGSRYDRLGIKADGAAVRARARAAWIASASRWTATASLTINTGKITLGPAARRARPARASSRRARPPAASDADDPTTPRRPMTDTPGREPRAEPAGAPVPAAGRAGPGRALHVGAVDAHGRADRRSAPPRSCASRRTPAGSASWPSSWSSCSWRSTGSTSWGRRSGLTEPRLDAEADRPAGHRGRARLQHLPGQLRALPRRQTARAGIGPVLNSQDKLFQHLNEDYLQQHPGRRRTVRLRQRHLA